MCMRCCRRNWQNTALAAIFSIFIVIWVTVTTDMISHMTFKAARHSVPLVDGVLRRENSGPLDEQDESYNATMILLLTYFRSGSTLTGDMFNNHPAPMYFFEPLRSLQLDYRAEKPVHYLNFECKFPRSDAEISDVSVSTLKNIFTCRFEKINVAALLQNHLLLSRTTEAHGKCARKAKNGDGIKECARTFRKSCLGYGVRAIKTVRLTMADTESLLKELPNLKIIHLIRDPRGMIVSRGKLGEFPWATIDSGSAKGACDEVMVSLNASERLDPLYPDRIKTILYEHIAEHPLEALEEILSFSNIPMDQKTVRWMKRATMSGKEDKTCAYCSTKANSTKTAYQWRKSIQFKYVKAIDKNCKSLYDKLGYKPIYQEKDLTNMTYKTRIRVRYLNNNL